MLFERNRKKSKTGLDLGEQTSLVSCQPAESRVGLHVLHNPPKEAIVDILFIHGLGGHWRDTWKAPTAQIPWPQQWLPNRIESARIMSYGYDSRVTNWWEMVSQNSVGDHANNLLRDLANHREEDDTNDLPILFVAHSLGGLVVQDALVRSINSADHHISQIFTSTKGIVFLGTPHSGTDALATWAKGLALTLGALKQTNPRILETLRASSELLYRIQTAFHNLVRDSRKKNREEIEITCFFEEKPVRNCSVIVTKHSASLAGYQATGLHYNHMDMTRFSDSSEAGFLAVTADLLRWTKRFQSPVRSSSDSASSVTMCDKVFFDDSPVIPHFPFDRNIDFVGREDILGDMRAQLSDSKCLALNGIGGVGKTEIAVEFCYQYCEEYGDTPIFWIFCDSTLNIELSFREIALRLKLPGYDDPRNDQFGLVANYLCSREGPRWLMVLDNADDIELMTKGEKSIARLTRNFRNGSIILTTRDRFVARTIAGPGKSCISVDGLSERDASLLLRSKIMDNQTLEKDIESEVLAILEYIPLCITQAAAYMGQSGITMRQYWLELTESESSLIETLSDDYIDLRRACDAPNSVLRSWKLSFEKIRQRCGQAADLLAVMASLDRKSIPRSLLQGAFQSRHQFNTALGTLLGFCLVSADDGEDRFRMHRLVQLATCFWLRNEAEEHQATAVKLVYQMFPGADSDDHELKRQLMPHGKKVASYMAHQQSIVEILASLQYKLAAYEWHQGAYDEASKTCSAASEKQTHVLGQIHIDTIRTNSLLGVIQASQGRWKEAYTTQNDVLEKKKALLAPNSLSIIDTLHDLAEIREKQGEYAEAQSMAEHALEVRSKMLGAHHPKTLSSLMSLATYQRRQARYKDAENLGRQALQCYEKTLGKNHILTLASGYALAGTLRESGQFSEAVAISERVTEGRKLVLGEEHPQTLLAINNLALGYRLNAKLEIAESLYRHVCTVNFKLQRLDHPESIQTCQNLAVVLGDLKKYAEAEIVSRETLSRRETVLGPEHLSTVNTVETLAIILESMGAYEEAERLAERAFKVREEKLGSSHTYTLDTLFVLASISEHRGLLTDAVSKFEQVRDGRVAVLGADHPATQMTIQRLQRLVDVESSHLAVSSCHQGPVIQV